MPSVIKTSLWTRLIRLHGQQKFSSVKSNLSQWRISTTIMSEHGQKVCFTLCVIITFIAYAVAKKKEAIVEPYWKEITLKEFEEFPSINEGSPTVVEFPSSDGKKKGGKKKSRVLKLHLIST